VPAGKVIDRYKVAKHFILDISPGCLAWRRDQAAIGAEAALDGIYHWLQDRVRGHVLICMLAACLAATSARTLLARRRKLWSRYRT